jgi:hypothetical protein
MSLFDLTDLDRGEGEWRNMQEVIRRTFRSTIKQIERQQEQINNLVAVTTNLREVLSTKMSAASLKKVSSLQQLVSNLFYIHPHLVRFKVNQVRV